MSHSAAIARCRKAYAANNIGWDNALNLLPTEKLEELAAYWEERSAPELTIRQARAIIHEAARKVGGSVYGLAGSTAKRAIATAELQYHGSNYAS